MNEEKVYTQTEFESAVEEIEEAHKSGHLDDHNVIQSLKQHNLKLTECLGEFLKAKDIYEMVEAKAKAKLLINPDK